MDGWMDGWMDGCEVRGVVCGVSTYVRGDECRMRSDGWMRREGCRVRGVNLRARR